PLVREDLGFADGATHWKTPPDAGTLAANHVVIVGAGLSGLGLGMQLEQLGIPFTILERNPEAGGTWFENRYPGAGVDTPNLFYSWSGHANPRWRRYFSQRDEILAYIRDTAANAGLMAKVRFCTTLTRADWDAGRKCWTIRVADRSRGADDAPREETLEARFLVSAIGHISEPNDTRFPGMEGFDGPLFHSARWPDDLDLEGKRVAIVGTGATAMQLAPAIAARVAQLGVYQRTAQWARPTPEYRREVSPGARWLFEHLPFYAQWYRFTLFWRYGDGLLQFLKKDPHWPHPARSLNKVNDRHREQMTAHIEASLAGRPDLIAKSVPDYPPYAKRILLDNGWYEMLLHENVELVTEPIARIDAHGIVTKDDKHRKHDVIVLATGFSIARLAARLDIHGTRGTLAGAWADDNPTAYLGITVPGFPNFFMLYGPNTNLGHGGSAIFHAECQVRYIARTLVAMIEGGVDAIDVRPEAHDDWVARVDAEHADLIWTHPGVSNWYRNRHGRVVSTSPFRLVEYWNMTHEADLRNYRPVG
ncbi:MAG TPA: NAD(P)/FAD-dependent oxidoreductase, partial [Burkholderiales bacterium]